MTLKLLIREIEPTDHNGRYLRENLRRIEQYLNDAETGKIQIVPTPATPVTPQTVFTNTDQYDVTTDGQTIFILSATPTLPDTSRMLINGIEMRYGTHYEISGLTLTFKPLPAGFALELVNEFGDPDRITVHYNTE